MKFVQDYIGTYQPLDINIFASELVDRGWTINDEDVRALTSCQMSIQFKGEKVLLCGTLPNNETIVIGPVEIQHEDILEELQEVINL